MNKAFIFDLDGVLIDDERIWEEEKSKLYSRIFGQEVTDRLGSTLGLNMDAIYEKAVTCGAQVDKKTRGLLQCRIRHLPHRSDTREAR